MPFSPSHQPTRQLAQVLIRNVDGDANVRTLPHSPPAAFNLAQALANALRADLFPKETPEAARLNVEVKHARHLVITGGRWKQAVTEWLIARGF